MPKRPLPAPERLTAADVLRVCFGALMIPLGITILVRMSSVAVTPLGVLAGGAFVAFGVYRLWLGWTRYRMYRQSKGASER